MYTVQGCTVCLPQPCSKVFEGLISASFQSNLVSLSIEVLIFTIYWCHLTVLPVACQLNRHSPDATTHPGIPRNRLLSTSLPFSDRFPPLAWNFYLTISFTNRAEHAARACRLLRDGFHPELVLLSYTKQANNIPWPSHWELSSRQSLRLSKAIEIPCTPCVPTARTSQIG